MTIKEIIDKLSEYNLEAEFNIVVDGFIRPFTINDFLPSLCFGSSEGVDLMIGDICDGVEDVPD